MSKIVVGIDPGVKTGFAIWDCENQEFWIIQTTSIIRAMGIIRLNCEDWGLKKIIFEDARKRKGYYGERGNFNHQGVGSIKRDCSIWQEFCEYHNIPFQAVPPQKGQTKWTADKFKKTTGWQGRTSEHSRDAALLVYGMT